MKPVIILSSLVALAAALPSDSLLEARQYSSDTANDLKNGACKAVTVIFGRGSGQSGNIGTTVGIPFFNALAGKIGAANLAVQGVDYPATYEDAGNGGSTAGAQTLVSLVQLASTKCPNTKVVLSGYRYIFLQSSLPGEFTHMLTTG
jgi:cutinase